MNTIGKILVILNFVFAIVVGAFLIFDFSTRTQWKRAYDELKREADVIAARDASTGPLTNSIASQVAKYKKQYDDAAGALKAAEDQAKADKASTDLVVEDYKNKLKDADISLQAVQAEKKRMTAEVALLTKTVADREKVAVDLEGKVKKYRQDAISMESLAGSLQLRIDQLEQLLDEKTKLLALKETQGGTGGAAAPTAVSVKDAPNPPVVDIQGKVEKVMGTLVQLSVGSDHGVAKNNTLEVFRTTPRAQYLGMIRITETYPHRSVGRLVPGTGGRSPLQEGDRVSSRITP